MAHAEDDFIVATEETEDIWKLGATPWITDRSTSMSHE